MRDGVSLLVQSAAASVGLLLVVLGSLEALLGARGEGGSVRNGLLALAAGLVVAGLPIGLGVRSLLRARDEERGRKPS